MNEPTEEQKKEFWERYGFKFGEETSYSKYEDRHKHQVFYYPEGSSSWLLQYLPSIDYNSLFRWAVPKAIQMLADIDLSSKLEAYHKLFDMWLKIGFDALALFWALWQTKESKSNEEKDNTQTKGTPINRAK